MIAARIGWLGKASPYVETIVHQLQSDWNARKALVVLLSSSDEFALKGLYVWKEQVVFGCFSFFLRALGGPILSNLLMKLSFSFNLLSGCLVPSLHGPLYATHLCLGA